MTAPYLFRERTSDARTRRRWEVWRSAAPLFEQHGYRGVTIDQLAYASAMSPAGLYHYFPSKAAIALFPLAHGNGLCAAWDRLTATLPSDPLVRLHALVDFAAGHADAWRLAIALARQMSAEPTTAGYAARLLAAAREDFADIARGVDPDLRPADVGDLYEAFTAIIVAELPGFDQTQAGLIRRLTDAGRGWLARNGVDPAAFDAAGSARRKG